MDLAARARKVQEAYWTFDPREKKVLLQRYPDRLNAAELLRLHHLNCLEMFNAVPDGEELDPETPTGPAATLCLEMVARFLRDDSPVRARPTFVWQGAGGESDRRDPDLQGPLRNASMTHLGCMEVVRLKHETEPVSIDFVPFDDLRGIVLARPAIYRYAKLFFEDGRGDEVVLLPLLYGVSWRTRSEYDRNGQTTRFCCHVNLPDPAEHLAIGVGHQDFLVSEEKAQRVVGLGSIGELMFGLEITDPRFDVKCRARGLDPAEIRRQVGGAGSDGLP